MQRTAVLNVVGLTRDLLKEHMPFLSRWAESGRTASIRPVLPAVTSPVQATYLTGKTPAEHGIVANGWYFRDTGEIRFWLRSDRLNQQPKIWETARQQDDGFTCANLFWRYATHATADYVVVERPMYPADGRKIPDVWAQPARLRQELNERLGRFPLFEFWGPNTSIASSQWIADAAKFVEEKHEPTLSLVYLPHLDYGLQRHPPDDPAIVPDLREIDGVCEDLITFFEERGVQVVVLSEYGMTPVRQPVSLNRVLRRHGLVRVREELGRELLEPGQSTAFAVADHQLAHVYVNDPDRIQEVRDIIAGVDGVDAVLDEAGKAEHHLNHPRSGELVALAEPEAWFTYYYWLDDDRAPDFARTVAIHRKPGYDPAEMFFDPELRFPRLKAGRRLLQKKLGFRALMDVIPLDPTVVKGQHGRYPNAPDEGPLLITKQPDLLPADRLEAVDVHDVMLAHLQGRL